jgi:cytochrome c oxidase cbb3-type subunit 3
MTKLICTAVALTTLLVAPQLQAQEPAPTPDAQTIEAGKKLFEGIGICASCHGQKGEGILGPTLMLHAGKTKWLHSDGSWDGLSKLITAGVGGDLSKSGIIMPPKGGSQLSSEQVRQVAAYVLELHKNKP